MSTSAGLAKRFSIHSTPAAILLRDRAMYPFTLDSSPEAEPQTLAAAVEAFIDGGYEQQDARAVPAEPSALSLLVELASFLEVQPNIFFYTGVACISIGVILFIVSGPLTGVTMLHGGSGSHDVHQSRTHGAVALSRGASVGSCPWSKPHTGCWCMLCCQ